MFRNARITLTLWYVLIIMAVSIAFSAFIYFSAVQEFDRALRIQQFRLQHGFTVNTQFGSWKLLPAPEQITVIEDERERVLGGLIGINLFLSFFSSFAGYFLAGRTLRPIQSMVDEQNRFITDASHELRTPLTALRAEIEVGLRKKIIALPEAKKLLESNLEEVIALQALSDNLLSLSQVSSGEEQKKQVSLRLCLENAVQKVASLAKVKNIEILTRNAHCTVWAIPERLTEVFTILLDNAIKYSPEKSRVIISLQKKDAHAMVTISDEGSGITPDDMPHVFDRFYRANKSRSKTVAGYGLGLSIAKKIIAAHSGDIDIEQNKPKGTKVIVRLPLVEKI